MRKSRILVYPCGTEIGLEIYNAIRDDKKYELFGGSSTYDHGRFVFENHIDGLPFITDCSDADEISKFNDAIKEYAIDFIYPAMDGVVTSFSKFRDYLTPQVIAPDFETCEITRSKKKTYEILGGEVRVPKLYSLKNIDNYPVFLKPDAGQGSVGTKKIRDEAELLEFFRDHDKEKYLICEYLPGEECTVDCFTNSNGRLVFAMPRKRRRIKNGIAVNTYNTEIPGMTDIAEIINSKIKQRGGWFFQMKQLEDGSWALLEVASRIAGSSSCTRFLGIDLPLLTVNEYAGILTEGVVTQSYDVEIDRALDNRCRVNIEYDTVYVDYDDTVILDGTDVNSRLIGFLFECRNRGKRIVLITRHDGSIEEDLHRFRISELFDEVIHLDRQAEKSAYIESTNSVYIDDSYGERKKIHEATGIPVFDIHNFECLL